MKQATKEKLNEPKFQKVLFFALGMLVVIILTTCINLFCNKEVTRPVIVNKDSINLKPYKDSLRISRHNFDSLVYSHEISDSIMNIQISMYEKWYLQFLAENNNILQLNTDSSIRLLSKNISGEITKRK